MKPASTVEVKVSKRDPETKVLYSNFSVVKDEGETLTLELRNPVIPPAKKKTKKGK